MSDKIQDNYNYIVTFNNFPKNQLFKEQIVNLQQ